MLFYHAFFLYFLFIDLYFLNPAFTAQIFIPTLETAATIGIPTNKVKEDTEN